MTDQPHGLARGLTNYGDADFLLYLRRSFAKSMGYSRAMLARPRRMIGGGSPADPANIVENGSTQTSPRNYPESCSQRGPKGAKLTRVRNANSRGVVCGAWAVVANGEGLITQRSLVQI